MIGRSDHHAKWWASVLSIAVYWDLGEDAKAESVYEDVEAIPGDLLANPISRAVLSAIQMRRSVLISKHRLALRQASAASQYLVESVSTTKDSENKTLVSIIHVSILN